MPELPEVEHARRVIVRALRDRAIERTETSDAIVVAQGAESFSRALVGARLTGSERRGKSVILRFAGGGAADTGLYFHLGMTGHIVVRTADVAADDPSLRFARLSIFTDTQRVALVDGRRLGRAIAGPYDDVVRASGIRELGPDALTVESGAALADRFRGRSGKLPVAAIKLALMDQQKIAGLGNIHAAEALFFAKLHPDTPTQALRAADWDALAEGIARTLSRTLAELDDERELVYVSEGGPNPFAVYRKDGSPCGVCGKTVQKIEQGGRSTYFCARCQKRRR